MPTSRRKSRKFWAVYEPALVSSHRRRDFGPAACPSAFKSLKSQKKLVKSRTCAAAATQSNPQLFHFPFRDITAKMTGNNKKNGNGGPALGFEAQLWAAADKMRGHMDASEYKHVALGL